MKKLFLCLLLSSLVLLASLCSSPTATVSRNTLNLDSLTVHFRDTLFNSEENFWISFDTLFSDSRCPIDVECVWEGNASVGLTFANEGIENSFALNTHVDFSNDTTISGYKISLLNVKPVPHTDSLFTANDYLLLIGVTN